MAPPRRTLAERFWSKVEHNSHPDACWPWLGSTDSSGYGRFKLDGAAVGAHRVAWQLTSGDLPPGLDILHRCDNPSCVRPEHLFAGTVADNIRDAVLKRRIGKYGGGSMTARGPDVWQLRVNVGVDPVTGRRHTKTRTVHGGARAARRMLAEFVTEVAQGQHRGTDLTFGEMLNRYLDQIGDELSPSTLRGYRRRIRARIVPALGRVPLRKLKAADLDRYYRAMERTDPPHSPSDIRQDHAIVSGALKQAVDWGYVAENVARRARPPRQPTGQVAPPPPPDVILALIAGAEAGTGHPNSKANPSLGLFLRLAAATGARPGELCALTLGDVDLETGALTIARNVVEDGKRLIVKDTKTHQARKVALDAATAAVLADHVTAIGKQAADFGGEAGPDWFVFTHQPGGEPWRPGYVTLMFGRLCRRLGARVRLYDLRHAHATYLLIAGVDVRTIAGRLGHDPRITLRTYGHFLDAPDRAAALVAGELLTRPT